MSDSRERIERLLDEAVREVRETEVDPTVLGEAADRVWARLHPGDAAQPRLVGGACEAFRDQIQPYLGGQLSEPRTILFEDHLQECLSCRKELSLVRDGVVPVPALPAPSSGRSTALWLGLSAAAVVLVGVALWQSALWERFLPAPEGAVAVVDGLQGSLFNVSGGGIALADGQSIVAGRDLKTARDSGAWLELRDGSKVELGERAEVTLRETRRGRTIELHRGNIIVQAARQEDGFLRVRTDDCVVEVQGTVFSVNRGLKGSRVSVIEGRVQVESGGRRVELKAGQQMSTRESLARVPVGKEIAWSGNRQQHAALLAQLTSLHEELEEKLVPGLTSSTRLLSLMPEDVVVYASLPNLSGRMVEAFALFEQRLQESPALRDWWGRTGNEDRAQLEELLKKIDAYGNLLGTELVVWFEMGSNSQRDRMVLLSEAGDPPALLQALQGEVARANAEAGQEVLRLVSHPDQLSVQSPAQVHLMVWEGLFAASPDAGSLEELARDRPAPTPFSERLAQAYEEGVGFLVALNLERILSGQIPPEEVQTLSEAGLLDTRFLLMEQRPSGDRTQTRAVLTFARERRGVASWLAAPGPMGALEFVSADAVAVGAFLIKDPVLMLEDVLTLLQGAAPEALQKLTDFQAEKGISIQQFAEPLGGEIVLALDGPLLPSPSWKVVLEVYDPAAFQETLDWAVEESNVALREEGRAGLELLRESSGGRVFYSLRGGDWPTEVHYLFVDGYLIAAPSRALLQASLAHRETGYTLIHAERFQDRLPADGMSAVSGLLFQDLGKAVTELGDLSGLGVPQLSLAAGFLSGMEPTLFYAYGGGDQITLGSTANQFAGMSVASFMSLAGGRLPGLFPGKRGVHN